MLIVRLGAGDDVLEIQGTPTGAPEVDGLTAAPPGTTLCSRAAATRRAAATSSWSPGQRPHRPWRSTATPRPTAAGTRARPSIWDRGRSAAPATSSCSPARRRSRNPGFDVIDAGALAAAPGEAPVRFIAYGGAWDDLIIGSQDADLLAGGSGDDFIDATGRRRHRPGRQRALDVDVLTRSPRWSSAIRCRRRHSLRCRRPATPAGRYRRDPRRRRRRRADRRPGPAGQRVLVQRRAETNGVADLLDGGAGDDVLIGGNGADILYGRAGNDVLVGDSGIVGPRIITTVTRLSAPTTTSTAATATTRCSAAPAADYLNGGAGNDLIFGDFGRVDGDIDLALLPLSRPPVSFGWTSLDADVAVPPAAPTLFDDADARRRPATTCSSAARAPTGSPPATATTTSIGGSTVAGGADGGDLIDAGAGNDWVVGDNGNLRRTGTASPRGSDAAAATRSTTTPAIPQISPAVGRRPEPGQRGAARCSCSTTSRRPRRAPTATTSSPAAPRTT